MVLYNVCHSGERIKRITYHRDRNLLWSAFFYVIMFLVLRLHALRPVVK